MPPLPSCLVLFKPGAKEATGSELDVSCLPWHVVMDGWLDVRTKLDCLQSEPVPLDAYPLISHIINHTVPHQSPCHSSESEDIIQHAGD